MPKGSVPRLVSDPGEIGRVPSAPPLVLPAAPEVFSLRAERLEALAPGQPFATFLRFMAALARAQRAVLARLPPPPPTATRALSNRPLLDRRSLLASTLWEDALGTIADALGSAALPAEAASVLSALLARPQAERARFAARIVDRHVAVEETAEAVFLVAALQTVWTREASALSASAAAAREMTVRSAGAFLSRASSALPGSGRACATSSVRYAPRSGGMSA
jgi:FdhE protein